MKNIFLIFITTYFTLVVCDWSLKKILYRNLKESSKIKNEMLIINKEKKFAAYNLGFSPTFVPQNFYILNKKNDFKYEILPISSLPNMETFLCDEGYGLIKYKTDRYGFRNDDEIYNKDIDVVLIGDSFVHGSCVSDRDTISTHLTKRYNVLNLGIGGTNPTNYEIILDNFFSYLKPKFLITVFYSNDYENFEDSTYEKMVREQIRITENDPNNTSKAKFKFTEKYQKNLLDLKKEVEVLYKKEKNDFIIQKKRDRSFFENKINTLQYHLKLTETKKYLLGIFSIKKIEESIPNNSKRLIKKIKYYCNKDCKPLIFFIPASEYWDYDYRGIVYRKNMKKFMKLQNINYIDLGEKVDLKKLYAPKGIHLSIEGYKVISNKIIDEISKLN